MVSSFPTGVEVWMWPLKQSLQAIFAGLLEVQGIGRGMVGGLKEKETWKGEGELFKLNCTCTL